MSQVIKEAFKQLCDTICSKAQHYEYYDFLNKDDLKRLFKRTKFFMFKMDLLGLTEPTFLIDYEFYGGFIGPYGINCSKLLNLSVVLVTKEHEILAHFNVRIQNYLSEKDKISSPLLGAPNESNGRRIDSGDYLETLLYGKCCYQLNYNEILFILDLDNYNCSLEEFRTNFKKCNSQSYNVSNTLKDFLQTLNITTNKDNEKFGSLTVNENMINKSSPNDNLLLHHKRHTHLHQKKVSVDAQKIIDDIYATYLNYTKPNH